MEYRYETKIRPVDFWKLSMYHTYHSLVGMCNLVFGAAMIGLTVRFWNEANDVIQALLFLACLLVPVVQPLVVYLEAKAQAAVVPQGAELAFGEDGIHVSLKGKRELIRWNRVSRVVKEAGMVIVFTDRRHGYMLTNRVLGNEKNDFYQYVKAHINTSGA